MSERQSNLTKRRRSAVSIMGSLIGLVKPLLHIMIAAIILGMAGFTIFGRVPRQSCSPVLAVITFISFGIFCFLTLMLDLSEEYAMKKSRSHVHSEMTVTYRQIYEELANEMEGEHK